MKFRLQSISAMISALFVGLALAAGPIGAAAQPAQTKATSQTVQKKAVAKKAVAKKLAVRKTAAKKTTAKTAKKRVVQKKTVRKTRRVVRRTGPSQATLAGLRKTPDPLALSSSVAYIVDENTGEELFNKNAGVELPIASVTKLMTAVVLAEAKLPMQEKIRITRADYVRSFAHSNLRNGMVMTREAVLKAALMSSDNRAAHALARTYPGGMSVFVRKMNEKARELGMTDSTFADPTGLDNRNHSTARDLAKLVSAAHEYPEIRMASTLPAARLRAGRSVINLHTTNRLIGDPTWNIGVQKTGFTTAAGRCMVLQSQVGERNVVMVVLDSPNSAQRATDMRIMRNYVATQDKFNRAFTEATPYELF